MYIDIYLDTDMSLCHVAMCKHSQMHMPESIN